ncbi:MAG: restriction endonuclease, partial [Isosphaeraceae bacterium]|nr:restriction endonuclease [Isosphaeraceae bacterium]
AIETACPDYWENLKDRRPFPESYPLPPSKPTLPEKPNRNLLPPKPLPSDAEYQPHFQLLDSIIPGRKQHKIEEAETRYKRALEDWKIAVRQYNQEVERYNSEIHRIQADYRASVSSYKERLAVWERERAVFQANQEQQHQKIDAVKAAWYEHETPAVLKYCEMVLSHSEYPDYCPKNFDLDYNRETRTLIVNYSLPRTEDLPSVKSIRYNQSQDKFIETHLSESALNKLYESLTYQIALRSLWELFRADGANALEAIVFNGIVETIDKSTGRSIAPCILSVQVTKEEFQGIDLEQVDPKACFKRLKGVSAARLHTLSPVAPVAQISRDDRRFVESYDVAGSLDDSVNLAAMDWEDFEHLIRELFAKEFSSGGGEVKVTQASRDGGVDAVAFDPDPIRGGKIIIQAKRYTNVVGVSAVRDLYGTVMNEGANKGILVTTSYYGSDAYEFAKGKPLTLLDGGNLLSLLSKHGHRARIDVHEAKKINTNRVDKR